jgi:hypothetical protein
MSLIPFGFWAASGGGAAGAFDLLETTTLTSSASSVTFSGLGAYSDYKHLQIRAVGRSDRATAASSLIRLQFNSDTGSNYAHHMIYADGTSVNSAASTSQVGIDRIGLTGPTGIANVFAANVIDILDFSNTSKNTTVRILYGYAQTENTIRLASGLWMNTNAVTSITLSERFAANIIAGSRFSLIGIK